MSEEKQETSETPEPKKKKLAKKAKDTWAEFRKFISRGNVIDMAVGVIVGGAFSAIVTAVTKILTSICTWGVPGGLSGLITVLPAVSASQTGYKAIECGGQALQASYTAAEWVELSQQSDFTSAISGMYTLHGNTYYYNGLALIDWGTLINAIISFIIIALTLFIILKTYTAMKNYRARLNTQIKANIEKVKASKDTKESSSTEETK